MSPALIDSTEDDDPVVAEYDVFITPELVEQAYLLQYPNRNKEQPYNARNRSQPLEMRLKPKTGFIEVDVPMNVHNNYDKFKGVRWGEALRRAKEDGQTAFGVAAGFERPPVPGRMAGGRVNRPTSQRPDGEDSDDDIEQLLQRFEDANDKGHVMNKQTLGGQILKDETGKPMYMLGAFRGKELHLTKLSGVVQMRPQFHHLDAMTQIEQAHRRREREASEPARVNEPRAVQMSIKAADGDNTDVDSTKNLLRLAQEEGWKKLIYHDEDSHEAYAAYHDKLFLQDTGDAPKLYSSMTNEHYLEAISAPRVDPSGRVKKKPLTKRQMRVDESDDSEDSGDDARPPQAEKINVGPEADEDTTMT